MENEETDEQKTQQGGMSEEDHIAWYLHDVMCSWAGVKTWKSYAKACAEFPPSEQHLPPEFLEALKRLVAIWADR
ncbi:MAG: hypothetical protein ACXWQ5_00465 [Ktedonobacterales bacterium]